MRKLLLILSIIFCSAPLIAGESFFRPLERQMTEIAEGDSFKGVIELWNVDNVAPEMIYGLKNKVFLDSFFVVNLEKPKWSENNPEVVVIEGLFVLVKKIESNNKKWKLGGLEIDVTIKELKTSAFLKRQKGFMVLDGNYDLGEDKDYTLPIVLGVALLILGLLAYFFRKKPSVKVEVQKEIDWLRLFNSANSREDFNELYQGRKIWIEKLGNEKAIYNGFLQASESILFKEANEDYELEELKVSIEPIVKELGR